VKLDTAFVRHNAVHLAVHPLRPGRGKALLLLHGLGECSPSTLPEWAEPWPGPVHALDFTGHGASTVPRGGGYTAEVLMGDADAALARLGPSTIVGRGLGAYVALMIAGSRPDHVRGAILCDGPGLAGGSTEAPSGLVSTVDPDAHGAPDAWALIELAHDVRPPDYATSFVQLATQRSGLATPITVCAVVRPPWLKAVVAEPGVVESTLDQALLTYAPSR